MELEALTLNPLDEITLVTADINSLYPSIDINHAISLIK